MKVLITGAGGMVGRNLTEHPFFAEQDLLLPPRAELDLRESAAVLDYIGRTTPDLIVHCAGTVGGIAANMREPVRFLVENIDVGRNVVLAAHEVGVPQLLNLGSSCMYPRGRDSAIREEEVLTGELEPTNEGYALAKIVTARLCSYVSRSAPDLRYRTLIPCNLYGRHDTFDPTRSHMIPAALRKLHEAKRDETGAVTIWGDGKARREFMYAGELADAVAFCAQHFDELPDLLNIGTTRDYEINEYYSAAARVVGFEGDFTHDLDKPVGMRRKLIDSSRLSKLGWQSKLSLEDGLAATYEYFLSMEQDA